MMGETSNSILGQEGGEYLRNAGCRMCITFSKKEIA